ncbi:hypothetical protein NZ698_00405 [Chryseobacterium sp. PBS4-4]|uniref:Uncharacterized protein n=1 Tax=Chryseobacterium edaphi TaxID=2976532 RepID=A0ABT2W066_9FLAO|nr:hypothetical protein [Chryseobacterium edaphi]MCU7615641.1 hypothetical protein [Chryseobacterium edaphi]
MLKKRKSPLDVLFPERDNIRMYHINKPKTVEQITRIPVSGLALDKVVMIDNHSYQYKGQQTIKKQGIKKTIYLFKGVSTSTDREFTVNKAPTFKLVNDVLKMN